MQLLKSLVIGMGVLILVGLALLAYGIVQKTRDPGWRMVSPPPAQPAPAASGAAPAARAFGDVNLRLPEGCAIEALRPDGERLYLTIGPAGPCARVVVVDVARGRVLGTIKTGP